ncbi:MAG: CHAT domain-containing protein [Saprospiraceae bacterium]
MRRFLALLLCLFFALLLAGQNADSQAAEKHFEQFQEALGEKKYEEALQYLDQGIALFQKGDNLEKWLFLQAKKGDFIASAQNQPFEAMQYMDHCIAKNMWRAPKNRAENIEYCFFYLDQSFIAKQDAEDFVQAKISLEKAYDIFRKGLHGHHDTIAKFMYFQLGNTYIRLGEFNSAKRIFDEGLAYSIANNAPKVAKYSDFGGLYVTLEDYPRAKQIFLEGVAREGLPEEDFIFTKIALGECLALMKDFDGALKINKEVEALLKKTLKETAAKLPEFRFNLQETNGILYTKKGNLDQALFWYKKALETVQAYPKGTKRQCAFYQICIGNLLLERDNPKEALNCFHDALKTMVPKFIAPVGENPALESLKAENVILRALHGKARAFKALNQLEKSLECYELIPIVEAKLRATHVYESSSLLALKDSRKRFHEAIDIAWQLYERSAGNPRYAERAFRLTELARGMLLLQSLVQARQYLPNDILKRDNDLRVRMAWLETIIAAERDKDSSPGSANDKASADEQKIADWERQLFDLKLQRQKLLADYPSYNDPDSLFLEVLAANDVHKLLRPDQAMADFFLTETDAYVFSFDAQGNFRWRKVSLSQDFREKTRDLVSYLWKGEDAGREQFLRQAWLLDSLLLEPELTRFGHAKSMVIVPDDVLMLVPFEILLSRPPNSDGSTWRDQPWLLANYNFGYAYSATLLNIQKSISEAHEKTTQKPPHVFGGFAPSYSKSSVYKLKNTCSIAKNVRKMLGGHALCDDSATEERFKNSAPEYSTLLLAMHGISDNEHPELSRLLFGDPGPDSLINNNILYASELQIMRLQADLVVLSACHSGSGRLEQGEGVYSLARAFAAAQVPATVMSLWLLHAGTAPPLVEAFFNYLQEGKTKDEALRLAKLDFLKKDKNFEMTHPFYWAGLAASGDMRALDLPAKPTFNYDWWWYLSIAAVVVVGVWWWRRRTKYKNPN